MGWNLDTIVAAAVPFFFLSILVEAFYSVKMKKSLYRVNDTIANLSLGITQQLTAIYTKAFPIFIFSVVQSHFSFYTLPKNFLGWAVAFIAIDFAYYWFHRMAHQVNIIWASHVAHHSSEEFNLAVALRQSSLQIFFSTFFYLPLIPLGLTWEMFGVCFGLNLIYQFFIHTEAVHTLGPLEFILNTPSHHRVHHGRNPKYIDKNHGGVFIIWDRLFGTFQKEEERPVYGITTPLQTFDPLTANLHHFYAIFKDASKSKNLTDFLNILFNKPGWRPHYLGGPLLPNEVDPSTYKKFDPAISKKTLLSCIFTFILLTLIAVALQNIYFKLGKFTLFSLVITELLVLGIMGAMLSAWKLKNLQKNKSAL